MTLSRADIEEHIIASVEAFGLSGHPVDLETPMDELGIDLPDLVEITDVARQRWGLQMTTDELDDVDTVGEMVDLISSKAGVS
jgi:acyl carrier protein